MKNESEIITAKEAAKVAWLGRAGVTGMDVGFKYVGGKRTTDLAIRLFVRKKLPLAALAEPFPGMLGKHKTDVIQREFKPTSTPPPDFSYFPVMEGGAHIYTPWNPSINDGSNVTSGMFVLDNITGQLMILGTFHGDFPPNTPIYQPFNATQSDGTIGQIGYLSRNSRDRTVPMDADLILYGAPRDCAFKIKDLGLINGVLPLDQVVHGMKVSKRGHYTGVTHATVDGVAGSVIYSQTYTPTPPPFYQGPITYENMLTFAVDLDPNVTPVYNDPTTQQPLFGHEGDSGSVIVDGNNNAVALFAAGDGTGGDGKGVAYGCGPPISLLMSALRVTPCTSGTILSGQVSVTSTETAGIPPATGPATYNSPPDTGPWGQSVSGVANVRPYPTCPAKSYHWTLTSVYQILTFVATAVGFKQPVFSWKINGQPLNDFNTNNGSAKTFTTLVLSESPPSPFTTNLEPVTLNFFAEGIPTYSPAGTSSQVSITPTSVQGHISVTLEVDVRELNAGSSAPITSQSATAMLDTQELTWEGQYYIDQAKCAAQTARGYGAIIHPWTAINAALSLPDPPIEVENALRFVTQLGMELAQLAVTQPQAAQELTRIFAKTLNVPEAWLSGKGMAKTGAGGADS